MSKDKLAERLRAAMTTGNAEYAAVPLRLLDEAAAALEAEAKPAPAEPVAWLVLDKDGSLVHAAAYRESAHEHINDAINEHGITEAARWVVRPAFAAAPATPAPVEAIREVIRISDRDHNAWNAVKSWLAAGPATPAPQPLTEQQIWDAVQHGVVGGIGFPSKAVAVARAIEQAHGIGKGGAA